MRWMWLVLVACGAKPPSDPVGNTHPRDKPAPATAAKEDCTSRTEGWKPGNVDRFSYEDANHKHGFRDGKGRVVITAQYNHVYEFSPYGIAAVVDDKHPFLFIDASGKVLAQAFAYDNGPDYFQEGYARIVDAAKKVGFLSERGAIAVAPQYESAASFCHGKAEVEINGETYFIDKTGNKTSPPPLDKSD